MLAVSVDSASVTAVSGALRAAFAGGPALWPVSAAGIPGGWEQQLRPGLGAAEDTAVIVATSGSSGAAKAVELTAPALASSGRATLDALGGPGAWLLALPPHHIAGLQVIARGLLCDAPVTAMDLAGGFRADAFVTAYGVLGGGRRYTSLVPTQLHRLLDAGGVAIAALCGFDGVLVGGAATGPALLERARAAGVHIVTTYGMSETCGGCVYDGVPLEGVRMAVDAPARSPGAVRLAGPVLASGYLRDPEHTAEAFANGWFATRDLGRIGDDGRLEVLGRADDVIVTGGDKVAPALVERTLISLDGVADACVAGIPDDEWGQLVAALVVPAGATPPAAAALRSAVAARIGRPAAPRMIRFAAHLPLLASGKPDREEVRRLLLRSGDIRRSEPPTPG